MEQVQSITGLWSAFNEAGKAMWERWLGDPLEGKQADAWKQVEERYRVGLEFGEQLTGQMLQMQHEWLQSARQSMEKAAVPQPLLDLADANIGLVDELVDARARLWQQWFDQLKAADFATLQSAAGWANPEALAKTWTSAERQAVELMSSWLASLGAAAKGSNTATSKAGDVEPTTPNEAGKRMARVAAKRTA